MLNNHVKILGGFFSSGNLFYDKGEFKGFATKQEEPQKEIGINFSEDCIQNITLLQVFETSPTNREMYFSISLTDGRGISVKSNTESYQKIYEKSLSSKKIPTKIIEKADLRKTNSHNEKPPRNLSSVIIMGFFLIILYNVFSTDSENSPPDNTKNVTSFPPVDTTTYSSKNLCKAAISAQFSKPIKIIKTSKTGVINELYYIRPDDGKKWRYACQLDGENIVWATIDIDGTGSNDIGRWRNNYSGGDAKITYEVNPTNKNLSIHMVYSDGSGTTSDFKYKDIVRK